ncbi:MAG: chemotaxis protein [Magnetococcus sp. DMHC-1]|nr:chemotaxis protein CheV [Magnetococcales bacterium]MBF0155025.1 chemotaxis protein CheV [Magnetococcales bacterium]
MDDLMSEVDQRTNLAFSNEMEMLTFFLTDKQLYGLNVFKIIELLECPKTVTRIPQSHPAIKGTIDFRGSAISLIDLSQALGLEPIHFGHEISYVMVCEYSTSVQGFLISQPNLLVHKSWDDIISPEGEVYDDSFLTAITYEGDQPIQILDVEKILSEIIGIEDKVSDDLVQKAAEVVRTEHQIMAVDDSRAARQLISSALSQMGIRHTVVENAEKALKKLESSVSGGEKCPYTIIFSDIEMPIMDGFTFTRKVKANPKLAGIHLALHSSLSNQSNAYKAKQMGADDFIPKFQPDRIVQAILDQLAKVDQKEIQ